MRMFRGYMIAVSLAAASLGLSGCALADIQPPGSPSAVADKTVLDEKALYGAELGYQAARTVVELATDAGLIKGELASTLAAADRTAYGGLEAARAAYDAGNATNYAAALSRANDAVARILSLIEEKRR